MGIKGVYSLLQSEPSRFGKQWVTCPDSGLHVFIDGPALHHHLVSTWVEEHRQGLSILTSVSLDHIPHTSHRLKIPVEAPVWSNENPCSSPTSCSTTILYKLTYSFLMTLFLAGTQEVHVVWDGLASQLKRETQIQRLEAQCHHCYQSAQRFITENISGLQPTVHLWGEFIMQEAIYDLQESLEREKMRVTLWNHFADSEADTYMGHVLHNSKKETTLSHQFVILSNDTDLLVYNSISGFVPLSTLIFEINTRSDNQTYYVVKGWMYTYQQFYSAFPFLQPHRMEVAETFAKANSSHFTSMPAKERDDVVCNYSIIIIAALAGCDYTLHPLLEISLNEVRNAIVQSDLGGLRVRDRNRPSSKNTVTAIIRCIGHILKMVRIDRFLGADEYMTVLGHAIVDYYIRTTEKQKPSRHLRKINVGFKEGQSHTSDNLDTIKKHFVQALIDISRIYHEGASCSTPMRNRHHQIFPLDVNLRRILDHGVFYCKPLVELHRSDSIWLENVFFYCRTRLYAVIAFISKQFKEDISIVEYVHRRQGSCDLYRTVSNNFAAMTAFLESQANARTPSFTELIQFIFGSCILYPAPLDNISSPRTLSMYACLLLDSCEKKLLLFAASFISSTTLSEYWQQAVDLNQQALFLSIDHKTNFLDDYNHLQVALFHSKLAYGIRSLIPNTLDQYLNFSRFLLDEHLVMTLWKGIDGRRCTYQWDFHESSRDRLLDIVFITVKCPRDCHIIINFCEWWKLWFGYLETI